MTAGSGRGRFVTVEGGEGVGKSLFVTGLADALRARGQRVLTTREPGGTPVADHLRQIFASPPGGEPLVMESEALLVSAARAQHVVHKILPALERGEWVLCDRYADSTRVYQGALGGLSAEFLESLIRFSTRSLVPDLTFLLDCDVSVSLARLSGRGRLDGEVARYDQADAQEHQHLRNAYLALAAREPRRFVRLAADREPAEVVAQALRHVEERFG